MDFFTADFNSSILIQTPIERQFARIRCPPMGERERSVTPSGVKTTVSQLCEENQGWRIIRCVLCEGTIWSALPTPFPRPPGSRFCIESQITAGSVWRELTIMKDRDGCLKKADYLGAQVLIKDG